MFNANIVIVFYDTQCRWVERIDSLNTMFDLIEAVVECLDVIRNDNTFNNESITKAGCLQWNLR